MTELRRRFRYGAEGSSWRLRRTRQLWALKAVLELLSDPQEFRSPTPRWHDTELWTMKCANCVPSTSGVRNAEDYLIARLGPAGLTERGLASCRPPSGSVSSLPKQHLFEKLDRAIAVDL